MMKKKRTEKNSVFSRHGTGSLPVRICVFFLAGLVFAVSGAKDAGLFAGDTTGVFTDESANGFISASVYGFAGEPSAPETGSRAAYLMDAETAAPLYEKNSGEEIPPASLTKLVTIHLALMEVETGRRRLDETVALPPAAWARNQPPRSSLMFLGPGQTVTLRELLMGLAVSSGNDAAAAVALHLAPGIDEFAAMMNNEFRSLNLFKTHFVEPSGISEYNSTTAKEFALFCRAYIALHPETLAFLHSAPSFAYPKAENMPLIYRADPGTRVQKNRNPLLGVVPGVDGLKTGYIDEAGYNIALTAERDGTRLIAVILGAPATGSAGERIRNADGTALLEWGFAHFKTLRPLLDAPAPARVWKGARNTAAVTFAEPLPFTVQAHRGRRLFAAIEYLDPLIAPLPAGSPAGRAVLSDSAGELRVIPLVTAEEVTRGHFFRRLWDSIHLFFREVFR
ncbi:MAG: D-alanyl-D-alanine carboxypeptidase [Spirochaetaceae bacterium]|jgi:D-alanyl-D-alanine carboxypeptidase (penicillin-binding protein 5/6)|nr:D-alanyl-D-alanine carboxypeptidase [Spirochaetaceae bacterium]